MKLPIQCRVCERFEHTCANGWLFCLIDRKGSLVITPELRTAKLTLAVGMMHGAYVCGQTHALVLAERYLERQTFEPVAVENAADLARMIRDDHDLEVIAERRTYR